MRKRERERGLSKRTLEDMATGRRICILCGVAKPFNVYHWPPRKGVPSGQQCRECRNEIDLARYHKRRASLNMV